MRHAKPYRKLSRQRSHYTALMRNLTFSLFQYERIKTTDKKAKEVRALVDKIVTLGQDGSLHCRRQATSLLGNIKACLPGGKKLDIVKKVFDDISKRSPERNGGHTRIIPLGTRPGDAARVVYLELTDAKLVEKKVKKDEPAAEKKAKKDEPAAEKKASEKTEKKAASK